MATHAINDLAAHAFELVNKELASTLDAARAELEGYVDGRAGPDALLRTAEHLHAARGGDGADLSQARRGERRAEIRAGSRSADARDGPVARVSRAAARWREGR